MKTPSLWAAGPPTICRATHHGHCWRWDARHSEITQSSAPTEIPQKPQTDSWLGLSLDEEVAALLSLFLAVRVRSGASIHHQIQSAPLLPLSDVLAVRVAMGYPAPQDLTSYETNGAASGEKAGSGSAPVEERDSEQPAKAATEEGKSLS